MKRLICTLGIGVNMTLITECLSLRFQGGVKSKRLVKWDVRKPTASLSGHDHEKTFKPIKLTQMMTRRYQHPSCLHCEHSFPGRNIIPSNSHQ